MYGAKRWCRWWSGTEAAHGRASGGMGTCQGEVCWHRVWSAKGMGTLGEGGGWERQGPPWASPEPPGNGVLF